jgi:predicted dehydrogenase
LAAGGAFTIAGTKSSGKVLGANDSIRIAVAGLNGRGKAHVAGYAAIKEAEITYLVDPDPSTYRVGEGMLQLAGRTRPRTELDIRKVLDDPNVDAVSIATPNHWHALMTVWACQAGKDVYVEKPCSHNLHEGRIAVETARKHNRIVQHGTQARSLAARAGVVEFIRSGQAGALLVSRGLCYKPRKSIGFKPTEAPPAQFDFNLWLGPAPQQPFHRNLVHYNWHWFWDTGNGDIGNQGVHEMDYARWAIPGATLPKSVISLGGRFGYEDQGQTANTQMAVFDFGPTQLIFEVRGLPSEEFQGQKVGNIFHCEGGTIIGKQFFPKGKQEGVPIPASSRGPWSSHFGNFVAAVRSRQTSDLNADILEGHRTSALCHLANISYRLGESLPFDPRTKAFGDNREAYETLARMEQHLEANQLPVADLKCHVGRKLAVDVDGETIVGDDEARALLSRAYRTPFVVPDKVA